MLRRLNRTVTTSICFIGVCMSTYTGGAQGNNISSICVLDRTYAFLQCDGNKMTNMSKSCPSGKPAQICLALEGSNSVDALYTLKAEVKTADGSTNMSFETVITYNIPEFFRGWDGKVRCADIPRGSLEKFSVNLIVSNQNSTSGDPAGRCTNMKKKVLFSK